MKLKKILAVTIGATLALSAGLALTACGGDEPQGPAKLGTTDTIKYDNYIPSISEYALNDPDASFTANKANLTQATKITDAGEQAEQLRDSYYTSPYIKLTKTDETTGEKSYRVYSAEYEKVIYSGNNNIDVLLLRGDNYNPDMYLLILRRTVDTQTGRRLEYAYLAPDGTTLLDYSPEYNIKDYVNVSRESKFVGNASTQTELLCVSYSYGTPSYFRISKDSAGRDTYSKVDSANVYDYPQSQYAVGQYIGKGKKPVYESTAEQPVKGDIAKYEYVEYDTKYEFYKNNELTGTVSLEYGEVFGFVGNYMYYEINTPLSPDATSGYNYVEQYDSLIKKYDYRLYRYDIVANTTAELNYDFKFSDEFSVMYNKETQSYDAMYAEGYTMSKGVFAEPNSQNAYKKYMLDAELNIALDTVGIDGMPTCKLDENRYLAYGLTGGMVVVNEKFEYVTRVGEMSDINTDTKLIKFTANGKIGFKDYDGKIVVAPVYDSVGEFYGDWAVAEQSAPDGNKTVFLSKTGTTKALPEDVDTDDKSVTVGMPANGIYEVVTYTYDGENETYKYEIFNYAGTNVKTFENDVDTSTVGGKTFIVDGTDWYLLK